MDTEYLPSDPSNHGVDDGQIDVKKLIDEIKRLRAELARYKTPNVDNVEVINERP